MKSRFFPPQTGQSSTMEVAGFTAGGLPGRFAAGWACAAPSTVSTHRNVFRNALRICYWTPKIPECSVLFKTGLPRLPPSSGKEWSLGKLMH